MRTVLLAMTEDQHDHRTWKCTGLIGAFVFLTLALNASSREQAALVREASSDSNDHVLLIFTGVVTLAQILTVVAVLSVENARGELPDKEALVIVLFGHAGTTFLHDFLLSLGSAENFVAASFFQPLMTLATVWAVTSVLARPTTWLSTAIIGLGCTFMSINSSTVFFDSDRTALICLLFCFAMILRNIVLRHLLSVESITMKFHKPQVISGAVVIATMLMVLMRLTASPVWTIPAFCGAATCVLSVSLLYVTIQLLKNYSITFVSLFHVWALLVEAIILTPMHHRPSLILLVVALLLIFLGHFLFLKDYVENVENSGSGLIPVHSSKPVNAHEQYTRIEFLLFAAFVMGIIFYVFQPSVSQRDLDTLSYVGLDKVIRKLLMVKDGEGIRVEQ